jgi:segregation and condensation protein B
MSLKGAVEAALFAAGGPLVLKEIAGLVGSPPADVEESLVALRSEYRDRECGLELVRHAGGLWAMQVHRQYTALVHRLVPPDLELALLKTLSVVALLQPVTQSRVVERRGAGAYAHVKDLVRKGFVTRERAGNSYELRTTPDFARRFRLKDDPEAIRLAMQERATALDAAPPGPEIAPTAEPPPEAAAGAGESADQLREQILGLLADQAGGPAAGPVDPVAAGGPVDPVAAGTPSPRPVDPPAAAEPAESPEPPGPAESPEPPALPGRQQASQPLPPTRLAEHRSLRRRILHGRDGAIGTARRAPRVPGPGR